MPIFRPEVPTHHAAPSSALARRRPGAGLVVLLAGLFVGGSASSFAAGPTDPDKAAPDVAMSHPPGSVPAPSPALRPLPGQLSSKYGIDPRDPESAIPSVAERNKNPLEFGYFLQDLLDRAEQARKALDYDSVIRYYRAVARIVPERAKAWSKLCEAYEAVKDNDRAIRACRYAIDREGAELQDHVRYVNLLLNKPGELSPTDRTEIIAIIEHLEKDPSLNVAANHIRCQLGVKVKDVAMLETCTKALAAVAPDDAKTIVFQWSLALQKGQRAEAKRLIDRARKSGVILEGIERMENVTSSAGPYRRYVALALGLGLAGLLALCAVAFRRRALTQRPAR